MKEESANGGIGKSSSENEKDDADDDNGQVWGRKSNISLLDQHTELKKLAEGNSYLRASINFPWNKINNNVLMLYLCSQKGECYGETVEGRRKDIGKCSRK